MQSFSIIVTDIASDSIIDEVYGDTNLENFRDIIGRTIEEIYECAAEDGYQAEEIKLEVNVAS